MTAYPSHALHNGFWLFSLLVGVCLVRCLYTEQVLSNISEGKDSLEAKQKMKIFSILLIVEAIS